MFAGVDGLWRVRCCSSEETEGLKVVLLWTCWFNLFSVKDTFYPMCCCLCIHFLDPSVRFLGTIWVAPHTAWAGGDPPALTCRCRSARDPVYSTQGPGRATPQADRGARGTLASIIFWLVLSEEHKAEANGGRHAKCGWWVARETQGRCKLVGFDSDIGSRCLGDCTRPDFTQ